MTKNTGVGNDGATDKPDPKLVAENDAQRAARELRRWPYTLTGIDETLDTGLIGARGRQILYQALSNNNLVAFVGSGVPMAYGRLSWNGWQDQQLGRIDHQATQFGKCADALIAWLECFLDCTLWLQSELQKVSAKKDIRGGWSALDPDPLMTINARVSVLQHRRDLLDIRKREIAGLQVTFKHMRDESDGFGGELPPVRFQVAQQLHDLLRQSSDLLDLKKRDGFMWMSLKENFLKLKEDDGSDREAVTKNWKDDRAKSGASHLMYDRGPFAPPVNVRKGWRQKNRDLVVQLINLLDEVSKLGSADLLETKAMLWADLAFTYAKMRHRYVKLSGQPQSQLPFADVAKMLLVDEAPHAARILRDGLAYGTDKGRGKLNTASDSKEYRIQKILLDRDPTFDEKALRRDFLLMRDQERGGTKRFSLLGHFKSEVVKDLAAASDEAVNGLPEQSRARWRLLMEAAGDAVTRENHDEGGTVPPRQFVSPVHRYVVGAIYCLYENPYEALGKDDGGDKGLKKVEEEGSLLSPLRHHEEVKADDFQSRLSLVEPELDPLRKLALPLGINRYLTLNYDFEIERLFEDRAYSGLGEPELIDGEAGKLLPREASRSDGLGGRVVDRAFERERADELIGFALDTETADASVFHLHGQATLEGKLVVTERDYMNMYLREDADTDTVNESIRTAFSSGPMLFLGLGMQEADILRPFRQFMSNDARARARHNVAMLAATGSRSKRASRAGTLFLRYGVHAVDFGDATVEMGQEVKNPDETKKGFVAEFDWLHRFATLQRTLKDDADMRSTVLVKMLEYHDGDTAEDDKKKAEKAVADVISRFEDPAGNPFFLEGDPIGKLLALDAALGVHTGVLERSPVKDEGGQLKSAGVEESNERSALALLFGLDRKPLFREVDDETRKKKAKKLLELINECGSIAKIRFEGDMAQGESRKGRGSQFGNRPLRFERAAMATLVKMYLYDDFWSCLKTTCGLGEDAVIDPKVFLTEFIKSIECFNGSFRNEIRTLLRSSIRDLRARGIMFDGALNAALTSAQTETLDALHDDWRLWQERWALSPPHRVANFARESPPVADVIAMMHGVDRVLVPTSYLRHDVENIITSFPGRVEIHDWKPVPLPETGDPSRPTGVRAFDHFLLALQNRTRIDASTSYNAKKAQNKHGTDSEEGEGEKIPALQNGRRYHLVAANRGIGKGSFLAAFYARIGLGQYIASSWSEATDTPPTYLSALFANLSFSSEVASNYDSIIQALSEHCAVLEWIFDKCAEGDSNDIPQLFAVAIAARQSRQHIDVRKDNDFNELQKFYYLEAFKRNCQSLNDQLDIQTEGTIGRYLHNMLKPLPRIERLRAVLNRIEHYAGKIAEEEVEGVQVPPPRFILTINAAELLFHRTKGGGSGFVKNREIYQFLELLTGRGVRGVPFDLVIIANEAYLGEPLIARQRDENEDSGSDPAALRDPNPLTFVPMVRENISLSGITNVRRREVGSRIDLAKLTEAGPLPDRMGNMVNGSQAHGAVDVEIDPGNINSEHYPITTQDTCNVHFARMMSPENFLIDNFPVLACLLFIKYATHPKQGTRSQQEYEKAKKAAAEVKKKIEETSRDTWPVLSENRTFNSADRKSNEFVLNINDKTFKSLVEAIKPAFTELHRTELGLHEIGTSRHRDALRDALRERYREDRQSLREWQQIRNKLSGNRFCMTIILAAAEWTAIAGAESASFDADNDKPWQDTQMLAAANSAEDFIRSTADAVGATGLDRREGVVLHHVLDAYEPLHRVGVPAVDMRLHHILLRHLAVIGTPTSVDVLVRAPQMRKYFDTLPSPPVLPRSLLILQALDALVRRGLVFQIAPHPRLKRLDKMLKQPKTGEEKLHKAHFGNREPDNEARYALHRLVQLHVMRKLGAEPYEFGELNPFAPSLFASMPAELPRLNYEGYSFLNELVSSLSQYPDTSLKDPASGRWVFDKAPTATRVQALRAALSIVRSSFSVAVVSRFDDYVSGPGGHDRKPPRGFFETHRIQLRWIIRKAWELLQWVDSPEFDLRDYRPDSINGYKQINACYRDEIVWLYNECGLICLTQGNLRDAAALLRQAISMNADIEVGDQGGPQHNRISLNLAITLIDRGRLRSADRRLTDIIDSEVRSGHGDSRVAAIATGYRGLVYHMRGGFDDATILYKEALKRLRVFNDSRACSIFSRHQSDLHRLRRDYSKAARLIQDSVGFAETGGHEDMVHRSRLAQIKLERERAKENTDGPPPLGDAFDRISKIEDYAEIMEMPTLACECLLIRAELLLDQGETVLAGSLSAQAMALARSNDMGLRLNIAMSVHARVLIKRGKLRAAARQLQQSSALAKRSDNQLAISRAESLLNEIGEISP
ncbi:SIR2 family protein [Ahrensia sp. R2A130]|uniref:SIR2 family protein n=1 Tax=Ahrensia sp. R2A130 TaxID=744979 RepID=UPI0001E0F138|nr:SIR2 family protein [Ahrensia sp. R2A130]EFL87442.1 hypothetical protein R2A130_3610 [Ahrensia sp. R2A130]